MLSEQIKEPQDYLAYSQQVLAEIGMFETYPQLSEYYQELCRQFHQAYYDQSVNLFIQLSSLLAVDAQIQILLDLVIDVETDLCRELGMSETEIIKMIKRDKKYFYREITGVGICQQPRWHLIYLSEE